MSQSLVPNRARRGRRILQFSVRTLFVVLLVCGLLMGAWSAYVKPYRDQARAIAGFKKLGGKVQVEPIQGSALLGWLVGDEDYVRVVDVNLERSNAVDADLEPLRTFEDLRKLRLSETAITNDGLAAIAGLKDLEFLALVNTRISDDGLRHVSGLTSLNRLYLRQTDVGDAGLVHLRPLVNLQHLSLVQTMVNGPGLKHLAGMTQMQRIYLARTRLDDEALAYVSGFSTLQHVSLNFTDVSQRAVDTLQQEHPTLQIVY